MGDHLIIDNLHDRHPGLTEALGKSYSEAACVCLSRHHKPPVQLTVTHGFVQRVRVLDFNVPDGRTRCAHANETDATEAGAYSVSLAAVEDVTAYVAVRRAETLTGADWYVAPVGTDADDMERLVRLEVSGTNGPRAEVQSRLRQKVVQAKRGQSNLPAIATVVGFKVLEIAMIAIDEGV